MGTIIKKCEAIFIDDNYYSDLETYADSIGRSEIESYPNDYKVTAFTCETLPLQIFSAEWIAGRINEENFSEEGFEDEYEKVLKALNECVDFNRLNSMMPLMNYESTEKWVITKKELLDAL